MRFPLPTRRTSVLMSLLAVALAGGAAYALIPQDGVITGCYAKATGVLRIIDAAVTSCRGGEVSLSWNQQGVPGKDGADGKDGVDGKDGTSGPTVDFVTGRVALNTACGTFCTGFRFSPEGYTSPADSQHEEAITLPIGPAGATMSDLTFTLTSPPPAGNNFQIGFTDGTTFYLCVISGGNRSCSPPGSATFDGPVHGFIDTSYQENTGNHVTFSWKRTF